MKFQEAHLLILSLFFPSPTLVEAGTSSTPTARLLSRAYQRMVVEDPHHDATLHDGAASVRRGMAMMLSQKVLQAEQMMEGPLLHRRKLQSSLDACNTEYAEFWQDQALKDAFSFYLDSRSNTVSTLLESGNPCAEDGLGGLVCDLDVPVNGETEFKSACAAAGGRLVTYSIDASCTVSLVSGGTVVSLWDEPVGLDCIPGSSSYESCHDAVLVAFDQVGDDEAAKVESGLIQADTDGSLSSVSCRNVGDDASISIAESGGSGEDEVIVDNSGGSTGTDDICETSYAELWLDQALKDAFSFYKDSRSNTVSTLLESDDACAEDGLGGLVCDLDVPVNGETEFKSACATAGGRLVTFSLDASCTVSYVSGQTIVSLFDEPVALDCIPGSSSYETCHDAILVTFNTIGDEVAAELESGLIQADTDGSLSSVSCRNVGDDASISIAESGGSTVEDEDEQVIVDNGNDGSTIEEDEEVPVVDNGSGSSKAFTRGISWFASLVLMMSLFGVVHDTI